tara:strand:- start:3731 stop:4285 length:555 start_codon:yes stop_codon:yes gene_type:complete
MAEVVSSENIQGVHVVTPNVYADERGFFVETYRREWIPEGSREMIQANRGDRESGCVVGLHYHLHQADYWYIPFGTVRVVLHDLRRGSPTEGVTEQTDLVGTEHRGIFIPPGVAHGFATLTDATITYMVDSYYNPDDELGVAWNDPEIAADWGVENPTLSERDQSNPFKNDIPEVDRPRYGLRN